MEGTIIKGYSGFYYVWDGQKEWECSLRGKMRLQKQNFLAGDRVDFTIRDAQTEKAVIEKVLPRRTELIRPAVANVEQVVLVVAVANPEPDLWLLDRLLIIAQWNSIEPLLCFNKADLISAEKRQQIKETYERTGFPVIITSTKKGWGIDELRQQMNERISVLAGPSGVGKSSLLNCLEAGLSLKTGEISDKLGRGKHTTRHVELIHLASGGLLADTPGFSQVFLPPGLKREELVRYYPDFLDYHAGCKFTTCLHRDEPQCAVRAAVAEGLLCEQRYERYRSILEQVITDERRY